MADKTSTNPGNQDLTFKVSFDGKPDKETKLTAYAFDAQGNLLASSPVSEGQARLSLAPAQARHARIFFAPSEGEVTLVGSGTFIGGYLNGSTGRLTVTARLSPSP